MTSVNLISPIKQAHDFKVRFREPINIKKNSKIYLNYAHFVRLNEIVFDTNQTMTLSDLEFFPNVRPSDGATPVALTNNTITIPALNPTTKRRAYSVSQLEDIIQTKLQELIADNPELNIYSVISRLDTNRDQSSFLSGFFLDDDETKLPVTQFTIDPTNARNAGDGDDGNGVECDYFKSSTTAANPHYDSYALGLEHFFHFSGECMGDNSQMTSGTYIHFITNVDMNAQQGNISLGLYSQELADEPTAFTGWTEKTTGTGNTTSGGVLNNPAIFQGNNQLADSDTANNLKKAILGSFLTIEITGAIGNTARLTSQLRICVPSFNTNPANIINKWTSIDQNIRKMRIVKNIPLRQVFGAGHLDQPFQAVLVFYLSFTDLNFLDSTNRRIYFKLYKSPEDAKEGINVIYDSKQNDVFFPQSFFTGLGNLNTGTAAQVKAKVNSQIPFTPIVAAQAESEGFELIQYRAFPKTAGGATDDKPNSILAKYKLNFSEQLGGFVGALQSEFLFPNVCEMDARFFYFEDVIASWRNDSFDVYLNGLPIKNFKNKENASDGGFSKPLLASVPVPFLDGTSSEGMGASHALLTGLYQPSIKNVLKLRNQEVNINSIGVQVKDTNTERPSEELEQVHICFTITDEENDNDEN
tara:strand:+ start:5852 stop:7777 length:1926 start_codon:yes stop_codon:yes gene_type:complete